MTNEEISPLSEQTVDADPWVQLRRWFADADDDLPNVTLATAGADGRADARVVKLRGLDERGLWFYSSRRSGKGRQLAEVPYATMVAFWPALARQVRLSGPVEVLPEPEVRAAYESRTRRSQIGYWANAQSEPITDRAALYEQVAEVERRFAGQEVPWPEDWLCYLLRPEVVELWQYGADGLHDRVQYLPSAEGWTRRRLQP